ncbi:hypothetical protein AB1N83_004196 [Pleurotus pulmonarius]
MDILLALHSTPSSGVLTRPFAGGIRRHLVRGQSAEILYPSKIPCSASAGWQANANTIRTDVDPVYCDEGATVGGYHDQRHSQSMLPSYPQGLPWPPAHTYPSFQQSGDFGYYQNSAWAPSPPVASQHLGQYPIQQPPNQFLLIESTPAISTASGNRRTPSSDAKFFCHLCQNSFTAKHNLECPSCCFLFPQITFELT